MAHMHHKLFENKVLVKRIVVYAVMTLSVVAIVSSIVLFVLLGYRFDSDNGKIEQYAMLQFNSDPAGASVAVDGAYLSNLTPSKVTLKSGSHAVTMEKTGYETWSKTVDIKAGALGWLNYALLVPTVLTVEPIIDYAAAAESLASPDGHYILVESRSDLAEFELANIGSETVKSTKLIIPTTIYSNSKVVGVLHNFHIEKWDEASRYVLIKHSYDANNEWLVLDTQDMSQTKNITRSFDFVPSSVDFAGTSGNTFFALGSGEIRKIDLIADTISLPVVSDVIRFHTTTSNIIVYVATGAEANQQIVGLYRDGDDSPRVVQTITKTDGLAVNATATQYFNDHYIAIADGKKVQILSGSYPGVAGDTTSLKLFAEFMADENVANLSFSPTGEYVLAQSGANFASYDLEYQSLSTSIIKGSGSAVSLRWLNDNYLWSDRDGSLTIREFDGYNVHSISPIAQGQAAAITGNGRYIYSIVKTATGYQLQRVKMVVTN